MTITCKMRILILLMPLMFACTPNLRNTEELERKIDSLETELDVVNRHYTNLVQQQDSIRIFTGSQIETIESFATELFWEIRKHEGKDLGILFADKELYRANLERRARKFTESEIEYFMDTYESMSLRTIGEAEDYFEKYKVDWLNTTIDSIRYEFWAPGSYERTRWPRSQFYLSRLVNLNDVSFLVKIYFKDGNRPYYINFSLQALTSYNLDWFIGGRDGQIVLQPLE